MKKQQPIGIFDSGIGGLTVAKAIMQQMPGESVIYFGDTAHLPYGDKSAKLVQHYSRHIADFLLQRGAKVILIACNTASAVAYETVRRHVGGQAYVFNVIDPVVDAVAQASQTNRVGVIGTKRTIASGAYTKKLGHKLPGSQIVAKPTPLFVPMIEEGFVFDNISNSIIEAYLKDRNFAHIDTLILGCTHYPVIKNQFRKFYDFNVRVIDAGLPVAQHLQQVLGQKGLLAGHPQPAHKYFVSDYTETFEKIARMFFEEEIIIEQLDIWNE